MPIYKTGKTKDGKQQYRVYYNYTDINGNKKQKTKCVYGLSEAKEMESELSKDDSAPSRMTLKQLYEEYIKAKEMEVRRSSLAKSKSILNNHVLNTTLAQTRLDRLSKKALQEWKNDIGQKSIMISTKNNAITELNTLLNYAVRMDYMQKNYMKDIGKFKDAYFQTKEETIHYYTSAQFKLFIAEAKKHQSTILDYGCYIFFLLAFFTGARLGEINGLKWSDVDKDTIYIRRSVCQKLKGKGYEETPPKNKNSVRHLLIPDLVIDELNKFKQIQMQSFEFKPDMFVCGAIRPIADSTLTRKNELYAAAAGLPKIRIHDFRHSHATYLINNNVNIMEVSRRLGHSDVKMTWNTYSHLYKETEKAALSVLNKVKFLQKVYTEKKEPT